MTEWPMCGPCETKPFHLAFLNTRGLFCVWFILVIGHRAMSIASETTRTWLLGNYCYSCFTNYKSINTQYMRSYACRLLWKLQWLHLCTETYRRANFYKQKTYYVHLMASFLAQLVLFTSTAHFVSSHTKSPIVNTSSLNHFFNKQTHYTQTQHTRHDCWGLNGHNY